MRSHLLRGALSGALAASVLSTSPVRARAEPTCPADEWFCEEPADAQPAPATRVESARPAPPGDLDDEQPEADSDDEPEAPVQTAPAPPPEVVPGEAKAPAVPVEIDARPPPPRDEPGDAGPPRPLSPWGVNLRLEGIAIGERGEHSASSKMGGVGVSARYAINRFVIIDGGFDSIGGRDYNGHERSELALSASALLVINPDEVFHTYGIFGFNLSSAKVDLGASEQRWNYFGAQAGLGIGVPLSRQFALAFELIGFVRGRTDDRARTEPEFTDSTGRISNTSGGGVFRVGVTVYF